MQGGIKGSTEGTITVKSRKTSHKELLAVKKALQKKIQVHLKEKRSGLILKKGKTYGYYPTLGYWLWSIPKVGVPKGILKG